MTTPINELDDNHNSTFSTFVRNHNNPVIRINTQEENIEEVDASEKWNSHPEHQTFNSLMWGE